MEEKLQATFERIRFEKESELLKNLKEALSTFGVHKSEKEIREDILIFGESKNAMDELCELARQEGLSQTAFVNSAMEVICRYDSVVRRIERYGR